jgi:hypothetical protein
MSQPLPKHVHPARKPIDEGAAFYTLYLDCVALIMACRNPDMPAREKATIISRAEEHLDQYQPAALTRADRNIRSH